MNANSFDQARQYVTLQLRGGLSPDLVYHGFTHTSEDVVPAVEQLALMEEVTGTPLDLLRTAAWFHDMGFLEQPAYHELIGTRIVADVLPGLGYTELEIETIRWIILATIIPQSPKTLPEKIMADADLNVLGRVDFMPRNMALRRELASFGKIYTDVEWYTGQIKFIEGHTFFTNAARQLFNAQKEINLAAMKTILAALPPED